MAPNQKQAMSLALEDLDKRSSAYGGMEDPLRAAPEIIKTWLPAAKGQLTSQVQTLKQSIPYASEQDLLSQIQAHRITVEQASPIIERFKQLRELQGMQSRMGERSLDITAPAYDNLGR
jgi:hypothetical protein